MGGVQSGSSLIAWNKLCFLGELVDNGEDRVETVGKGKIGDEVHADIHPRHHAWLQWNGGASRHRVASFEVSALITARDIGFDVGGQSRLIILVFDKFLSFLVTQMAGNRRVVMRGDDLHV